MANRPDNKYWTRILLKVLVCSRDATVQYNIYESLSTFLFESVRGLQKLVVLCVSKKINLEGLYTSR